jgi:acyl carrier protein phosphodiesterase
MNYLAHFHLAGHHAEFRVGGLLGDYVKGPLAGDRPMAIEAGITLHRRIDQFSHRHPLADAIANRLPAQFRRYSGILQDMISDYFLSRNWRDYHGEPLADFAEQTYQMLGQHRRFMPTSASNFSQRMQQYQLLTRYQQWQTIDRSLAQIGERLTRSNPLAEAGDALENHLPELESVFHQHYPKMIEFASQSRELLRIELAE